LVQKLDGIDFDDVVDYWKNFFPELKTENDIRELLDKTSGLSSDKLKDAWRKSQNNQEYIAFIEGKLLEDNKGEASRIDDIINNLPQHDFPYINFIAPLLQAAFDKMKHSFDELDIIQDKSLLLQAMVISCYRSSYKMFFRTLILETNVAKEHGWLEGNTSESRADYFKFVLLKDKMYIKSLYKEYSSLIRLLQNNIENYINYIYDIIVATAEEKSQLERKFNVSLGNIMDIETSFGDSHNGGKTVAVITFTNGIKIVVKPRNMVLEQKFNEFINKLNKKVGRELLDLKYARVHSRANFGWMEFVEYKECDSKEQVEDFYKRIGQYLCLLYALNAKDFHHENLIALGEYPILIDLEALLHIGKEEKDKESIHDLALRMIGDSVYSIYLLPTRSLYSENNGQVNTLDIGGVGGTTKQLSPLKSVKIIDANTDNVKVEKDYNYVDIESNNPRLNNEIVSSDNYIDEIQYGFQHMYNWILKNKETFLEMVEVYFNNVITRVIVKPTMLYTELLSLSYHPDLLRDNIHREVFFNRIGMAEFYNNPGKIALNEYQDLLQGDVPYFSINSNEDFLRNSSKEIVADFKLSYSPLEIVLSKINNMSIEDLEFQTNIIDFTFMHTATNGGSKETGIIFNSETPPKTTNTQKYLEVAKQIGDRLIDDSITNTAETERTWFGLMVVGKEEVFTHFSSIEYDLYKGNSGIALYLAYLAKATQDNKYREAALQTLKSCVDLLNSIDEHPEISMDLGAFTGISGIIYSVFHIGDILDIDEYKEIAFDKSQYLVRNIDSNQKYEFLSGSAGALGVLISMYENTHDYDKKEQLLTKASIVANHIIKNVVRYDNLILWGSIEHKEAYTGFAHGTSGITSALARYYKYKKDPKVKEVIKGALEFESTMFSHENNNWKMNIDRDSLAVAWCHGAPGILLNRSILLKYGFEVSPSITKDIERALRTTMDKGFGHTYVMCHGDIGNLGVLYQLAATTNNKVLKNSCDSVLENYFENYVATHWDDNAFRSVNIYGLMIGIAGLGYYLLKYGCQEKMQDILWLE
jgi:type 2 lantibiotic biosynthesis protein LanM